LSKVIEKENRSFIEGILSFSLSAKLKFSIKVSLSIALAYLIPLSQGWSQASTAAITVMLIAAMGSVNESVMKGAMRVVGTIIGAVIGMTLIAIFPQERFFYLISLSIIVAIPLYLVRAYKGDPSIFMLTAMTMMLVFKNGEVDDVFIYGIDKTYMTIFGITVYSLVGVFLWPVDIEDSSSKSAVELTKTQLQLFLDRDASKETRNEALETLHASESKLEKATVDTGSSNINIEQWHTIKHNYKSITDHLTLLSMHDKETHIDDMEQYVQHYKNLEVEITRLFNSVSDAWESENEIDLSDMIELEYRSEDIKDLTHLERASLITAVQEMKKLYESLRRLATKLNRIHSPMPTYFDKEMIPHNSRFLWGDIEHLKGVLVTFIIFWTAVYFWVTMNPPGGFMVVALATGLSVLTTFTPIKPSILIIVFTISFIFATFMYVAILPNLRYGWELGLFIFIYSFISFHMVNPKMSIFFLLGLFTFGIANEMYYDFSLFLLILLMFYTFLMLLHIFYYVPFSTRPEHMFTLMKKRIFLYSQKMFEDIRSMHLGKHSVWLKLAAVYSSMHLNSTVKKMQLWNNEISESYFNEIDKQSLIAFTKSLEKFTYLVELLYHRELQMKGNPLLKILSKGYTPPYFSDLLALYAKETKVEHIDSFWKDSYTIETNVEQKLSEVFEKIDFEGYQRKDIAALYEILSLRRSVWLTFFETQKIMEEIDFNVLKQSRF